MNLSSLAPAAVKDTTATARAATAGLRVRTSVKAGLGSYAYSDFGVYNRYGR